MKLHPLARYLKVKKDNKIKTKNSKSLVLLNNNNYFFVDAGQLVVKRWNNIRDQWLKWRNRDKHSKKSGAAASKLRKYLYHEQLNFLEKGLYRRATDSSMADNEHTGEAESQQQTEERQSAADQRETPDATEQTSQTLSAKTPAVKTTSVQQSARKRKRGLDEFELRMLKSIEAGDQEDRNMQFFKGILPSVQKFTDNQIVDFQMGVLQVIKNIQNTVSIPTIQPQQQQIYASYSHQHTQQYPYNFPLQNSQQHQPIPSSIISHVANLPPISCPTETISPPFLSPASNDTQSSSYSNSLSSPLTQNSNIDF